MAATQAIGETLIATDKPFVSTGGTLMLATAGIAGRPGTEDDQSDGGPRTDAANYTISLGQQGVRSSVVRLAPMVHSELDHHGFTHALIGFARDNGVAAFTGDGSNRWPAANTHDVGALYRLALEKAPAGSTFHGVGDTGISRKVIAETIAGKLGVQTKSITDEEAPQYLGFLAAFAGLDNPTSNDKTRAVLGWNADPPRLGRGHGDRPLLRLRHSLRPRAARTKHGRDTRYLHSPLVAIFGKSGGRIAPERTATGPRYASRATQGGRLRRADARL